MRGYIADISRFVEDYRMEMLDEHTTETTSDGNKPLAFYDIGIAEIVFPE